MHASYGLEGGTVVLSAALELENLDMNELEAILSDIDLALARHVPALHDRERVMAMGDAPGDPAGRAGLSGPGDPAFPATPGGGARTHGNLRAPCAPSSSRT